jgi:ketosteroid isomerase-like protein
VENILTFAFECPAAVREQCLEGLELADWFCLSKVADLTLRSDEIEDFGSQAVEVGTVSASAPGEGDARVELTGKYIVLWKQDANGAWQIHRDIWNWDA